MVAKINELYGLGQSVWLDFISRDILDSGELNNYIQKGVVGMTSNPTIFSNAISNTDIYDVEIKKNLNSDSFELYDLLTIKDIQDALDLFSEVYVRTNMKDGYVSLEVSPDLAYDVEKTVSEAVRLHEKVNRPNLMVKVPATKEGLVAVEQLVSKGINVNVTLIFSPEQYLESVDAYNKGIAKYAESGGDISKVHSVSSVFVSRIDGMVDPLLYEKGKDDCAGKIAVANSIVIYEKYKQVYATKKWSDLVNQGANKQRVLWASTGIKNPKYSDVKYIEELIGDNTVNTVPLKTLEAYIDHGKIEMSDMNVESANDAFKCVSDNGVNMDEIYEVLLSKGVVAFEQSFKELLTMIDSKIKEFKK